VGNQLRIIDAILIKGDNFTRWADIHMMIICEAKERSREQLEALLSASGFRLDELVPFGRRFVANATAI